MKQQAAIFALEGLEKYDNKRPLENFLWTHVRNRLFNYKRETIIKDPISLVYLVYFMTLIVPHLQTNVMNMTTRLIVKNITHGIIVTQIKRT